MAEKKTRQKKVQKEQKIQQEQSSTTQKVKSNKLELLVTIVPRNKCEYFVDLIQSFEVNMQLTVRAQGTANAQILSLVESEDSQRSVIFSVVKEERVQDILNALEEKFDTIKKGKGIAYTIPFTSIIGVAIYGFLSNNQKTVKE